jgi:hypothetical protein
MDARGEAERDAVAPRSAGSDRQTEAEGDGGGRVAGEGDAPPSAGSDAAAPRSAGSSFQEWRPRPDLPLEARMEGG